MGIGLGDLSSSDFPGFQGQSIFPELSRRERMLRASSAGPWEEAALVGPWEEAADLRESINKLLLKEGYLHSPTLIHTVFPNFVCFPTIVPFPQVDSAFME